MWTCGRGPNAGAAAAEAAKIEGVRKVLHADGASLAKWPSRWKL